MKATLFQSLLAQVDRDFRWVVVCDSRIDEANHIDLQNMVGQIGGSVLKFDPIATGRLIPSAAEIVGDCGDASTVAISRIDDDDMIATDFVESIRKVYSEIDALPCAIAFSQGVELYIKEGLYRQYENPHIALGLTVVSRVESLFSPYQVNHRRLHETMEEMGGSSVVVAGKGAEWVYIRRPDSDSTEVRKEIWPKNIRKIDEDLGGVFLKCGLSRDWFDLNRTLILDDQDVKPDIFLDEPLPRLTIKGNLLKLIREEKKRNGGGTPAFNSLVAAFYAI